MTQQEYKEYEQAVAEFFKREGLNCLTDTPPNGQDNPNEYCNEPYFSWQPCDVCGSTLGGDRVDMSGYNPTTNEIQEGYSVCVDCQYYVEYGQLDDMTMLDMTA